MAKNYDVDLMSAFSKLPEYIVEIGVIEQHSKRKQKVNVGLTNAQIMFINENGSPINKIPARPVLQMTIDWTNKNILNKYISKAIEEYIKTLNVDDYERELKKLCVQMEKYARDLIYKYPGNGLTPNAPSTIKRKGYDHPLFNTGQLARSITCQLVKI